MRLRQKRNENEKDVKQLSTQRGKPKQRRMELRETTIEVHNSREVCERNERDNRNYNLSSLFCTFLQGSLVLTRCEIEWVSSLHPFFFLLPLHNTWELEDG